MALNKPVIEFIVDDIVATLQNVTTANGYNQDLAVDRPSPSIGNKLQDGAAIVYLGQRTNEDERPQQYSQYLQIITVRIHVAEAETSNTPIDQRLNQAVADMEKVLCQTETVRQRGGWAIDTWSDNVTFLPSAIGSNEGDIDIDFIVQYRTVFGNPFLSDVRSGVVSVEFLSTDGPETVVRWTFNDTITALTSTGGFEINSTAPIEAGHVQGSTPQSFSGNTAILIYGGATVVGDPWELTAASVNITFAYGKPLANQIGSVE